MKKLLVVIPKPLDMKLLAIIVVSALPLLLIAQSKGKKETKTIKQTTFTKKITSDNEKYVISDSVTVENGKGEKKSVYTILRSIGLYGTT